MDKKKSATETVNDILSGMREATDKFAEHLAKNIPGTVYAQSFQLVEIVEDRLTKRRVWMPKTITRTVVTPVVLFLRGGRDFLSEAGRFWVITLGLLLILGSLINQFFPELKSYADVFTLVSMVGIVLLMVFAAPSTYCSSGVNDKHVSTVQRQLRDWEILSPKRVELIQKNVKMFEDRVKRRLLIFRWLLAACWAAVSPLTGELFKAVAAVPPRQVDIGPLIPSLMGLAIAFIAVECYAKGVEVVFRSVDLGCNESIAHIERESAFKNSPQR